MAVNQTIYVKTLTWNSLTWDNTSGGPLALRITHSGRAIEDRTGDDQYPPFVAIVDSACRVSCNVRDVKWTIAPSTGPANMVATLEGKIGVTTALNIANLTYEGVVMNQDRATVGGAEHSWVYQAATGSTAPIS